MLAREKRLEWDVGTTSRPVFFFFEKFAGALLCHLR